MSAMTTTPEKDPVKREPATTVINADFMDDETFFKHMTKRHRESLGGLLRLYYVSEEMSEIWRIFHDRLHTFRVNLGHVHGDGG